MEARVLTLARDGVRRTSLFLSGTARRCVLIVGSQTEAQFTTPYAQELAEGLKKGWSVAQVELGSSRVGYGSPDHESDADDVNSALIMLTQQCNMTEVVLYGSGTGVQVVLETLATGSHAEVVSRVVLHGGVVPPDTNPLFSVEGVAQRAERALALISEDRGEDVGAMAALYDIPVTPARLRRNTVLTVQEALWQPAIQGSEKACKANLRGVVAPALFLLATEVPYNTAAKAALQLVKKAAEAAIGLSGEDVQVTLLPSTIDERRRVLKGNGPLVVAAVHEFLAQADARREKRRAAAQVEAVELERRKRIDLAKAQYAQ